MAELTQLETKLAEVMGLAQAAKPRHSQDARAASLKLAKAEDALAAS